MKLRDLDLTGQPMPEWGGVYSDAPATVQTSSFDWGGLLNNAIGTYGQITAIKTQADIQKAQAANALANPFGPTITAGGLSIPPQYLYPQVQQPQTGLFGIPLPMVLLGGGLLAVLMMRGR